MSTGRTIDDLPRWIPWVEANVPEGRYYDDAVQGARIWAVSCDQVCISTRPQHVEVIYPKLMHDLDQYVKIIPGVKTAPALGTDWVEETARIDNLDGWERIARAVEHACDLTGSRQCVIENECWKFWLEGRYEANWPALSRGLRLLGVMTQKHGIELIWYAMAVYADEAWFQRSSQFVQQLLAAIPNRLTLVTQGWATPNDRADPTSVQRQVWHEELQRPMRDITYWYPNSTGRHDWQPDQLPWLIAHCPRPSFVYMGCDAWIDRAIRCGQALRRARAQEGTA
jgi:hypothetical protein